MEGAKTFVVAVPCHLGKRELAKFQLAKSHLGNSSIDQKSVGQSYLVSGHCADKGDPKVELLVS